jgi:hypothetical protein
MTPATIIREARADGVNLALSPSGTIKATGDGTAVRRWLAVIRERRVEIIDALKVGAGDTATASRWWLIRYPDRDPVEVACCPPATRAEMMVAYPAASAVEPFKPIRRQATAPLTADEEGAILTWLAHIEEADAGIITEVLAVCRNDADARAYYLRRAAE